jgi:hypothetical protein
MSNDRKPAKQANWDVLVDAPADAVWEATTGEGIANGPPVASTSGKASAPASPRARP